MFAEFSDGAGAYLKHIHLFRYIKLTVSKNVLMFQNKFI